MKYLSFFLIIFSLPLVFVTCSPDQDYLPENFWKIPEGSRPMVIAHGGAKLLWPENTMLAFTNCVIMGANVLEMDLRMTNDEIIVTHHDAEIDSTSNGTGLVSDWNYDSLKSRNFGFRFKNLEGKYPYLTTKIEIATLEDLFITFGYMKMIIEIKDEGEFGKRAAEVVRDLIIKHNMQEKVIVASFNDDILDYFLEITDGSICISTSQKEAVKFVLTSKSLTGFTYYPEAVALQLPLKQAGLNLDTRKVINSAHNHNMAMHYWTINDKEEMRGLIEKGADGIITDRPDIMIALLLEMGF